MVDFTNHGEVKRLLGEAQDVEDDNRQLVREDNTFIDDPQGQWEMERARDPNSPRYTFDITTPIVEQIAGAIEEADFAINVKPAGGDASKDVAQLRGGMIRNSENISSAKDIYSEAGRVMVTGGISGWHVVQDYVDSDSFDQDLLIEPVADFQNRVWFDPNAKMQTKEDADYSFIVNPITRDKARELYPDRELESVSRGTQAWDWGFRPDSVFIGQIYYKKEEERKLLLLSDGRVVEDGADFEKVKDELEAKGITVVNDRKTKIDVIMSRLFDNRGWLDGADETVFRHWTPLIPCYGNYKIQDNKAIYRGVVRKLKDTNRILNYSLSREIEEGALAPRSKMKMTKKMAKGLEKDLATLNTNNKPVMFYNHDPDVPGGPGEIGGAKINPGLRVISDSMPNMARQISGIFAANLGDNPGLQSGVAIDSLRDQGDTGNKSYMKSVAIAICHTGRIINNALDRTYDVEGRLVRDLHEDGSFDMVEVNKPEVDQQTGEAVILNDLSSGKYDVTCKAGKSFDTRQEETVSGLLSLAAVLPEALSINADLAIRSMNFPGSDAAAERVRDVLFDNGQIPLEQMTDEEIQKLQAAMQAEQQQAQQPDPLMVAAQAEMVSAQNEQARTQADVAVKSAKIQQDERKMQLAFLEKRQQAANDAQKTQQAGVQVAQAGEQQQFDQMIALMDQRDQQIQTAMDMLTTQVKALVDLQTAAQGPVVGPGTVPTVAEQYANVNDAQATTSALADLRGVN